MLYLGYAVFCGATEATLLKKKCSGAGHEVSGRGEVQIRKETQVMTVNSRNRVGVAALAGLVLMAGVAHSAEPVRLTDADLDTVAAGFNIDSRLNFFRFDVEGASIGSQVRGITIAEDFSIYQGGSVVRGALGLSTGSVFGQAVGNGATHARAAGRLRVNITAPN